MKAIKYIFSALVGMAALASCDSNITDFEYQGYTGAPKTIDASAVTSEALPGAIRLNWTVPADSTFSYMKISYVNPANQENVTNVVSIHTRTLLIENTLKKYGDYTFTFQAFNDKNEAGAPMQVKAQSGLLPATVTYTKGDKINVTADMLSTDDQEPSEGPIKNLVDGNYNSFFHTRWSSPQKPLPQYIQIDFKEAHQVFMFWYRNRNGSQVGPENLDIQISNDGEKWEGIKEIPLVFLLPARLNIPLRVSMPANRSPISVWLLPRPSATISTSTSQSLQYSKPTRWFMTRRMNKNEDKD